MTSFWTKKWTKKGTYPFLVAVLCAATSVAVAQRTRGGNGSTTAPATAPGGTSTSAPREDFATQFGVVADRNIFVKSRTPPVRRDDRQPTSRPERPPPSAEESLVLRGVVIEDEADGSTVLRAYFEDQRTRSLVRVTAGDALAKGHVVDVSIDAIAFENQGAVVWVRIGDNLLGERSNSASSSSTTSATTSPTDGTGDPAAPLSDIERRMRERRQRN